MFSLSVFDREKDRGLIMKEIERRAGGFSGGLNPLEKFPNSTRNRQFWNDLLIWQR